MRGWGWDWVWPGGWPVWKGDPGPGPGSSGPLAGLPVGNFLGWVVVVVTLGLSGVGLGAGAPSTTHGCAC